MRRDFFVFLSLFFSMGSPFLLYLQGCIASLSGGATVYTDPGASGFTPANPLTCNSYISAGYRTSLLETISRFKFQNPADIQATWYVEPHWSANSKAMIMQLAWYGGEAAKLSVQCFFYSPSQVDWTDTAECGPGTARKRPGCSVSKPADVSGDGRVDIVDVILVLDHFGDCSSNDIACMTHDLDCNSKVDLWDTLEVLKNWSSQ